MNTQSLNRAIGLSMSALQQAMARNGNHNVVVALRYAIKMLNRARSLMKQNNIGDAMFYVRCANDGVRVAKAYR